MFTGIIEKIGKISKIVPSKGNKLLEITADLRLKISESVAINGACLTVTSSADKLFQVEAMAETLRTTNLNHLRVGDQVNLEQALALGERLAGHFVQGHVDEIGRILSLKKLAGSTIMEIGATPRNLIYVVKKGSVAVEGVSLTICDLTRRSFSVALIPFTLDQTTLGKKQAGDQLNIEYDMLAKHIASLLSKKPKS